MKIFGFCLLSLAVANDFVNIVETINSDPNSTWVAQLPTRFTKLEHVKQLCGTWQRGHPKYEDINLTRGEDFYQPNPNAPTDFDSRTNWPKCTCISKVRDQSACGSCWAFGATEAFEDSRCISTGKDIMFSADDTAGCCTSCGNGCSGGQPSKALQWMSSTGVVTGADYFERSDPDGGCKPYEFPPCAHHVPATEKYPKCPSKEYSIRCTKTCSNSKSGKSYSSDKTNGGRTFSLRNVQSIMTALTQTGPLSVAFTVYSDFPTYKSGVYVHKSGSRLGGHAVELIGYGTMDGTDYWLVKNSWNEMWGDGGTFKIKRGVNECGIENDVTGIKF